MGTIEGYSGYGAEQGCEQLRSQITSVIYHDAIHADEVFISDGSKCDIGRLQLLFGSNVRTAVQDPTYPANVDNSVIIGQSQVHLDGMYQGLIYMPCLPENQFFPEFSKTTPAELIYICSPNNPTGSAATENSLKSLLPLLRRIIQLLFLMQPTLNIFRILLSRVLFIIRRRARSSH